MKPKETRLATNKRPLGETRTLAFMDLFEEVRQQYIIRFLLCMYLQDFVKKRKILDLGTMLMNCFRKRRQTKYLSEKKT